MKCIFCQQTIYLSLPKWKSFGYQLDGGKGKAYHLKCLAKQKKYAVDKKDLTSIENENTMEMK